MNKQPIEMASDPDLRPSAVALRRAARRAHELAHQTGTAVVISRDGVVQHVQPKPSLPATPAQKVSAGYKAKG